MPFVQHYHVDYFDRCFFFAWSEFFAAQLCDGHGKVVFGLI
jgi:hypothetical protein